MNNFKNISKTGWYVGQWKILNKCIRLNCNIIKYNLTKDSLDYIN